MGNFISFVDAGKGYIMDARSAISLVTHATETPLNPFNRSPLTPLFLKRLSLHKVSGWVTLPAGEQTVTDVFRLIEDLGYYTDPTWYIDLGRHELQRLYIELADIWFHRAGLSNQDRARIAESPFGVPVATALIMRLPALKPMVLRTLKLLVSAASARSDRQLGVMYVLGALSIVSEGAGTAFPWLVEMFSPGVTSIVNGQIVVAHPSVLGY